MAGRAASWARSSLTGAAEELFVEFGEFAGEDDGLGGAEDGSMSARVSRMRWGAS